MARGWESKSVEEQQSVANIPKTNGKGKSAEEIQRAQRRRSLELTRANVLNQLQNAQNDRHRELLRRELAFLESEMGKLAS